MTHEANRESECAMFVCDGAQMFVVRSFEDMGTIIDVKISHNPHTHTRTYTSELRLVNKVVLQSILCASVGIYDEIEPFE